jgi:hypothetical protein
MESNLFLICIVILCIPTAIVYSLLIVAWRVNKRDRPLCCGIITDYGIYDEERKRVYYSSWMHRYHNKPVKVYQVPLRFGRVCVFTPCGEWLGHAITLKDKLDAKQFALRTA